MTSYRIDDSSMDESFIPDKGEEAKWRVDLHMNIEHMNLKDEQLKLVHEIFKVALGRLEEVLED